jgi:uncharacterized heparinase superfamily protein
LNSFADRLQIGRLALGKAMSKAWRNLVHFAQRTWPLGKVKPTRIVFAPQELRTADPTIAADIYAGYYAFSGQNVAVNGVSPFDVASPGTGWAQALHSFTWLRHLRAAGTTLTRDNARILVRDFTSGRRDRAQAARAASVVANRLVAWLCNASLLVEGVDGDDHADIMAQMGRDIGLLRLELRAGRGLDRLRAATALTYASLCVEGAEKLGVQAQTALAAELDLQILPDGGHISRNPQVLIDLLLDLLPLRGIYASRSIEAPRSLMGAIDRMIPMLRLLRHGNGEMVVMNGMGATRHDILSMLIAYDDGRSITSAHAAYSGYLRLQAGETTVIADVGPPPPVAFSGSATAGTLAFELSSGQQRIVVNCGMPRNMPGRMLKMARSTAASSTLTLNDTSSVRFVSISGEVLIVTAASAVDVVRHDDASAPFAEATHDGYRAAFGFDHMRRWQLENHGAMLAGEDVLVPSGAPAKAVAATPFEATLRFHLNPAIRCSLFQNGTAVVLALPGQETWTFDANGLQVSIEESVFFAAADGSRRSEQLVVTVPVPPEGLTVLWRFARIGAPATNQ